LPQIPIDYAPRTATQKSLVGVSKNRGIEWVFFSQPPHFWQNFWNLASTKMIERSNVNDLELKIFIEITF